MTNDVDLDANRHAREPSTMSGKEARVDRDDDGHNIEQLRVKKDLQRRLEEAMTGRGYWFKKCLVLETELTAACAELEQAKFDSWKRIEQLARAREELKDLQGANRALGQDVAVVKKNRDYWYDKATDAEAGRDKTHKIAQAQSDELTQARDELAAVDKELGEFYCPVLDLETDDPCGSFYKDHGVNVMRQQLDLMRTIAMECNQKLTRALNERDEAENEAAFAKQAAQEQSDEVQELWLSPCQKAGLEGLVKSLRVLLKHAKSERDYWLREHDELEATLAIGRGAVAEATKALGHAATTQAAIVEAAEAAVHTMGRSGVRQIKANRNLVEVLKHKSRAAAKLLERLAEAERSRDEWRAIWDGMTISLLDARERLATLDAAEEALADCGSRGIYTDFDGPVDAIMQMAARIERLEDETMIEIEITGKEIVEALQHERAQRQVAEMGERAARKALQTERQLRRKTERVCEATSEVARSRGERLEKARQRTTRAEALAQLVNEKTAALLERLANDAEYVSISDEPYRYMTVQDTEAARALAARIREALGVTE